MHLKNLAVAIVPLALLWSCGTPLVWRGPPGTGQQDLAEARSECQHRADAFRAQNAPNYRANPIDVKGNPQGQQPYDELYRITNQMFQQCMTEKGYTLVAANR